MKQCDKEKIKKLFDKLKDKNYDTSKFCQSGEDIGISLFALEIERGLKKK